MRSIQGRLTMRLVSTLVFVFLFQWLVASYAMQRVSENYVLSRLEHDAESLLVALTLGSGAQPRLEASRLNPVYQRPFSGHYFRLILPSTDLRSRSLWDQELNMPAISTPRNRHFHTTGPSDQSLLVLDRTYRKQGVLVRILVAEDITPIQADLTSFWISYAVFTLTMLGVLVGLHRVTVQQCLRPLQQARVNLRRLNHGEVRKLDERVPNEILPLVREINRLVQATEERLTRSRQALGNLAHALKTPLTVLSQLTRKRPFDDYPDLQRRLQGQVEIIYRHVDRQLRRARLAGEGIPGTCFLVSPEMQGLVDALKHIYQDKALAVEVSIPQGASFVADREDMLELMGNLFDNAFKWARRRVRLVIEPNEDFIFTIEDDGPGVSEESLSKVTMRGMRFDESTKGHGLGLAIAEEIVEHYDGKIEFGRSQHLGGFWVRVCLPCLELNQLPA